MKIAVLGKNGMLGWIVEKYLRTKFSEVVGFGRRELSIEYNDDTIDVLDRYIEPNFDYIINCIGAIKPAFRHANKTGQIYTNAIFPRELADWADMQRSWTDFEPKVIHITTDCVFDGADGWYTENSPHNPTDAYGMSKSLGEPHNCMTLRTSVVGPEIGGNKKSLVEWLLSNVGGNVNGYANHMWNGLTTLELAKCIGRIINGDMYSDGVFHVFSEDIDKFSLLQLMNSSWNLGIEIERIFADNPCNRTLRTAKELNRKVRPASMADMMKQLRDYVEMDRSNV